MSLRVQKLGIVVADIVDFGTTSGVSSLIAGSGVSLSPASGIGTVKVTNAGVVKLLAGAAISLSPAAGTGTVTVTSIIDTITPTTVGATGQTAGVNAKSSASDHKHQLDVDRVRIAGDTMTGVLTLALADSPLRFQTATDTDPEFQFHLTGTHEWGIGAGAGPDLREQIIRSGNDRMLRLLPVGTGGVSAYQVQDIGPGGVIRQFVSRSGRAGIEDQFGTHLNDIERTRLTLPTGAGSVGAGVTVNDITIFAPSGTTVKVWYANTTGTGAGPGITFTELLVGAATGVELDANASNTLGDPGQTTSLATVSGNAVVTVRRRNISAKTAFTWGGLFVITIE